MPGCSVLLVATVQVDKVRNWPTCDDKRCHAAAAICAQWSTVVQNGHRAIPFFFFFEYYASYLENRNGEAMKMDAKKVSGVQVAVIGHFSPANLSRKSREAGSVGSWGIILTLHAYLSHIDGPFETNRASAFPTIREGRGEDLSGHSDPLSASTGIKGARPCSSGWYLDCTPPWQGRRILRWWGVQYLPGNISVRVTNSYVSWGDLMP